MIKTNVKQLKEFLSHYNDDDFFVANGREVFIEMARVCNTKGIIVEVVPENE